VGSTLAGPARRGEVLTDVRLLGPRLAQSAAGPDARIVPLHLADSALLDLTRPGDVVDVLAASDDDTDPRVVATDAIVVPLMVSTHGDHVRQIEYYAGLRQEIPAGLIEHDHRAPGVAPSIPMRVTGGLDAAPELGAILLDAWRSLPATDRGRPVLLLAHGPQTDEEAAHWSRDLGTVGQVLAAGGLTAEVRVALVRDDAAPEIRAAAVAAARDTITAMAQRGRDSVVVMPVLISTGSLDRLKLPGDLAGVPAAMRPAPLAPSPRLARWIERVAADALARRVAAR